MNIKTLLIIIIGVIVFAVIWVISMISALSLLVGSGIGILLFKPINEVLRNINRSIYLTEKVNMENRKKELESELEKLKKV